MREILYKAKRTNDGEWIEGHFYSREWENTYWIRVVKDFHFIDYQINPETISEFTGIYDIDKVKIFENDIIEGKRPYGNTWVVTWDEKRCAFYLKGFNESDFCAYDKGYKLNSGKNEVIGNIFDK